jgi:hypothetical protein
MASNKGPSNRSIYGFDLILTEQSNRSNRIISITNPAYNSGGSFSINERVIITNHPKLNGLEAVISSILFPDQCSSSKLNIIGLTIPDYKEIFVHLGQIKKIKDHP